VVVGSPGFVCENFVAHLKDVLQKKSTDIFLKDLQSKMITAHCSSGYQHSLKEILSSSFMNQKIASMACASETVTLDKFFETLALCEDKCTYGPKSVEVALTEDAIETMLISDKLFRSKNLD
jgi:protein pelota